MIFVVVNLLGQYFEEKVLGMIFLGKRFGDDLCICKCVGTIFLRESVSVDIFWQKCWRRSLLL